MSTKLVVILVSSTNNAFIIIIIITIMSERAGRCIRPLYECFSLQ